jgi:serine/threonine transporter
MFELIFELLFGFLMGNYGANLVLIAAAVIPAIFLLLRVYRADKVDKEPPRFLFKLVMLGLAAAVVAVIGCYLFPMTLTLQGVEAVDLASPQGVGEVLTTLLTNIVANPVDSIASANFIGVLMWSALIGIAMRHVGEGTKKVVADIAEALTTVVRWIISCAPFGILGLVYAAVAQNGPEIFLEYGPLILLLVGCMLFIALVTNPLMVFILTRKNPYPLVFRVLKDSAITAFFTRSSAANIPVNMSLCNRLGLNRNNYSVSIPLGATINMAGAAVTITVMAMQAAYTHGVAIDFGAAVILSVLAAISACGASGVPGGSLLLIPMACSLFGIPVDIAMQVVGVGFIIGVIQDSCETALNSSSDVLFTATAEYREWIACGRQFTMGKDNVPLAEADAAYKVVATNME